MTQTNGATPEDIDDLLEAMRDYADPPEAGDKWGLVSLRLARPQHMDIEAFWSALGILKSLGLYRPIGIGGHYGRVLM